MKPKGHNVTNVDVMYVDDAVTGGMVKLAALVVKKDVTVVVGVTFVVIVVKVVVKHSKIRIHLSINKGLIQSCILPF